MTFSGRFVLGVIEYAALRGADRRLLLKLSGIDVQQLSTEDTRLSSGVYNAVLEHIVDSTGDKLFGLHLGEYMNLSASGIIGQITKTSSTVLEAMQYCCEFASLGCRALPLELEEQEDKFVLSLTPDRAWARESKLSVVQTIDGMVAFFIREFHTLTLNKYYPIAGLLSRDKPTNSTEHERIMKCPVRFGQRTNEVHFSKAHVQQPVITSDHDLLRVLVEHAERKVQQIDSKPNLYNDLRKVIVNMSEPQFPGIDEVARNMNTSVRTLQRRLGDTGHTYKELVEELRQDMAYSYLQKPDLTINEVAYLLNYADASAFIRSFKRWTGQTPLQYRTAN